MAFSTLQLNWIEAVRRNLPVGMQAWLVGGALRDLLLERPLRDMDFVLPGDARQVARSVAQDLGGVAFILDESRDIHRVILAGDDGSDYYLDFIHLIGGDIQADLAARDFTINALAVELTTLDKLIDPLGGVSDLRAKNMKACSSQSMLADPIRCLRGVRLANTLGFQLEKDTISWIKAALPQLEHTAPERIRDEFFQIFHSSNAESAIRVLDTLGGIKVVFPELKDLKNTEQTAPHQLNAWEHSLVTLTKLEELFSILTQPPDREGKGNWLMSMVSLHLGRYRGQISAYLLECPTPPRSRRGLLFLAALYHDAGKPETATTGEDDRRHFYRHERAGTTLVGQRGVKLALSRYETTWVECIVRHHMRIHHLASQSGELTPRVIYRFFQATDEVGVAVCLLSLADLLATFGATITREVLERELVICRQMLATWWERPNEILDPPALMDGDQIMESLQLEPGPLVGEILEAIRLGQVEGRVKSPEDGLDLARLILEEKLSNRSPEA
jgi:tRNA nucleotidyltransferase/poly(A) polymerase